MSTSEPLAIVQSKFVSGVTVVTATEASLIQGWIQSPRYIALIYKGTTHALAIFLTSRTPPQVYSDLTLEGILPIDQDFKCGIEFFTHIIGTKGVTRRKLENELLLDEKKIFQLNKKEIIDKYISFKNDVLEKYDKSTYNIDESIFQTPAKLHLTI